MDVLGLLQSKKKCLRRFLTVSETFLASAEQGDLSSLESFELQREAVIKALGMYDRKITEAVRAMPMEARTPALSQYVQRDLDDEAYLVQTILKTDNRIVACIEREKERLSKEMAANRKNNELTGRFKSTWVPESGEGLDKKV
jgi:hypothetical protein